MFDLEDRVWVEYGIWELGPDGDNIVGLDFLASGGVIKTIPLGGSNDTSWNPQSVLAPIIRRRLAHVLRDVGLDTKTRELLAEISDAHTARVDGVTGIERVDWGTPLSLSWRWSGDHQGAIGGLAPVDVPLMDQEGSLGGLGLSVGGQVAGEDDAVPQKPFLGL